MKKIFFLLIFLVFTTQLFSNDKEDAIKAVVLERISQFIQYKNISEKFVVCVYGDEDLAESFKTLYKDRKYKGSYIQVIKISSMEELVPCSILYVRDLDDQTIKKIVSKKQRDTLLVSEEMSNLYDGFMIVLYFEDNKLKFAINKIAIKDANLNINYRLLKVASKIISSEGAR